MDQLHLIDFDEIALSRDATLSVLPADDDDDDEIILIEGEDHSDVQLRHHPLDDVDRLQQQQSSELPSSSSIEVSSMPPSQTTSISLPPAAAILPPARVATSDLPPPQVSTDSGADHVGRRFNGRASLALGVSQIVVGVLCVTLGVASIITRSSYYFVCHGFWTGLMCVCCGIVGIGAYRLKTSMRIALFLTLSTLSTACAIAMFVVSVVACIDHTHCSVYYYSPTNCTAVAMNASLAINLLMCVMSMVVITFCVTSTTLSAKACCDRSFCLCDCCFQPSTNSVVDARGFCLYYSRSSNESGFGSEGNFRFHEHPPPYTPTASANPPPTYTPTPAVRSNRNK